MDVEIGRDIDADEFRDAAEFYRAQADRALARLVRAWRLRPCGARTRRRRTATVLVAASSNADLLVERDRYAD